MGSEIWLSESGPLPGSLADGRGADSGEAGGQARCVQDALQVGADCGPPGNSTGAGSMRGVGSGPRMGSTPGAGAGLRVE